jgi:hypothetical protein
LRELASGSGITDQSGELLGVDSIEQRGGDASWHRRRCI